MMLYVWKRNTRTLVQTHSLTEWYGLSVGAQLIHCCHGNPIKKDVEATVKSDTFSLTHTFLLFLQNLFFLSHSHLLLLSLSCCHSIALSLSFHLKASLWVTTVFCLPQWAWHLFIHSLLLPPPPLLALLGVNVSFYLRHLIIYLSVWDVSSTSHVIASRVSTHATLNRSFLPPVSVCLSPPAPIYLYITMDRSMPGRSCSLQLKRRLTRWWKARAGTEVCFNRSREEHCHSRGVQKLLMHYILQKYIMIDIYMIHSMYLDL